MLKRVCVLFFVFCFILGILAARLVVINAGTGVSAAYTKNSVSSVADTSRGMIYDRNMKPLVSTTAEQMIAVKPSVNDLNKSGSLILPEDRDAVYKLVSSKRIGIGRALKSEQNDSCLQFEKYPRYSDNGLLVHTVGYIDGESNGVSGLEKYYNEYLKKNSGSLKIICNVDARSKPLEGEALKEESNNYRSQAGLQLTIDRDIQEICERALELYEIGTGAAVVLDVETSEILALASVPEYSQSNPADSLNDKNSPFINRAITPYCVGSVFKAVVACAAVESGVDTSLEYECNGAFTIGENNFSCHKKQGHGKIDMFSATANSCNPYFINLALLTGKEKVCEAGANLGLGSSIELCDGWKTPSGIMPDADSIVSPQDLANLAFGQGRLLASPLQMAAVYAAIANGGVYRAPSLMKAVIDENGDTLLGAELPASRRVMHESTANTVGALLYNTVESMLFGKAKPLGVSAAGKTATAQSGQFDENGSEITQSWFCGYFPYESPKYAVTVFKENGSGGSADCAPVFRYIAEKISENN